MIRFYYIFKSGFTLIELIIVIVVLGILAVTAAPQFIDFGSDARASTMSGVKSAAKGSQSLIYGKSAVQGVNSSATATVEGVDVVYGYPAATETGIIAAMDISADDFTFTPVTGSTPPAIAIISSGFSYEETDTTLQCQVIYTEAADADTKPTVVEQIDGC